jgi:CHAT domain-containing protein
LHLNKTIFSKFKRSSLGMIAWVVCLHSFSQRASHDQYWNKILAIDSTASAYYSITNAQQKKIQLSKLLDTVNNLKKDYEACGFEKDSVYGKILHRIGSVQFILQMYAEAVKNLTASININASGKKNTNVKYAIGSYFNMALLYYDIKRFDKVLLYNDTLITLSSKFSNTQSNIPRARLRSSYVYNEKGGYQEAITEATLGITVADSLGLADIVAELYIERAKAYEMQKKIGNALNDISNAISILEKNQSEDYGAWANAHICKAEILADEDKCEEVLPTFQKVVEYRKKTTREDDLCKDYNAAGYILMYKCNNFTEANKYFLTSYQIALKNKNNFLCAIAYNNIAQLVFEKKDYATALRFYQQTLQFLVSDYKLNNNLSNPPHAKFLKLDVKNDAELILDNKSKCLLYLYKATGDSNYLLASLQTALLADSLIDDLRHEQTDELSKLYWRNDTRDFFARSLEASFLNNNPGLAFFFMERSRAVLLNDKINELGASLNLPKQEKVTENDLLMKVTYQQEKLNDIPNTSKAYTLQLNKLLLAKHTLEKYIESLEQTYPTYYQYKYEDAVPSLRDFQSYLSKNHQSFVHYFIGDTTTYILGITPTSTKLIRLSQKEFNKEQLSLFLQLCANKEELNNHYDAFASLSNSIYTTIFQPLNLPKGRTIICMDNIVIPFEALCTDAKGKNFLLHDHSFDYVYSARFLMKQFNNAAAKGNFAGFAPVSFNNDLKVAALTNAAVALKSSSSYYSDVKLFTHEDATRKSFFSYAASYSIVNIFSHAKADTTENEPVLYMQDAVIHLSELQRLNNPATKFVLLSACQTNVGKTATGEGIYSLARGFAAAGIPSVSATLWNADEETIYEISKNFNQYLSEGMNKDEALQKAKLDFIRNNDRDKMLPYYWSNMILIGSADAIKLIPDSSLIYWSAITVFILVLLACIVVYAVRKIYLRKRSKQSL